MFKYGELGPSFGLFCGAQITLGTVIAPFMGDDICSSRRGTGAVGSGWLHRITVSSCVVMVVSDRADAEIECQAGKGSYELPFKQYERTDHYRRAALRQQLDGPVAAKPSG